MSRKVIAIACLLLVGAIAVSDSATAHLQVGDNSSQVCHSQPHPRGSGTHTHAPGGADDQCKSPAEFALGLLS